MPTPTKDSLVEDSLSKEPDFEECWKAFPHQKHMGKAEARIAFQALTPEQQLAAITGAGNYGRWVKREDCQFPKKLANWLRKGEYADWQEADEPPGQDVKLIASCMGCGRTVNLATDFLVQVLDDEDRTIGWRCFECDRAINGSHPSRAGGGPVPTPGLAGLGVRRDRHPLLHLRPTAGAWPGRRLGRRTPRVRRLALS
jgi:hypothetical protein